MRELRLDIAKTTQTIVHMMVWFFGIMFFLNRGSLYLYPYYDKGDALLPALLIGAVFNAILFYLLVYFFLPRWTNGNIKKWKLFLLFIACLLILVSSESIFDHQVLEAYYPNLCKFNLLYNNNLPVAFLITILGFSFFFYSERIQQEKINQKLIEQNLKAELNQLKAQINPHFLFNTINNIYSLAKRKSELTAESIFKLSQMMRYILNDEEKNLQPLSNEIDFLENYIGLQRLRISEDDNIEIKVNIERSHLKLRIAPLLLIPFIENAFKYGISLQKHSFIHISLSINVNWLELEVINSNNSSGKIVHDVSSGIGLENVRKRLSLLYPNKHTLIIDDDTTFKVSLKLKLT